MSGEFSRSRSLIAVAVLQGVSLLALPVSRAEDRVNYNRDIRPILSNVCYTCHGPDKAERSNDLRLDVKASVFGRLESGKTAVVPGHSDKSELYRRITNTDADERMPPTDSGKKLTPQQIVLLKKWIDQGGDWKAHWSFIKPVRPRLPEVKHTAAVRNAIDRFVLARLEREGLEPESEASRTTLIRRLTFDLTGLPPTLGEIDNFLADKSPDAYEKVVDRLLDSPRYGEQMARYWLDAARYGDTHGMHLDNVRSIWPYRDWVIRAFNHNMPFNQFTIEQLAGDLLPNATRDDKVATGFVRCNVSTSEGGSIPEEFRVRYVVDRTVTMSTVWMGLTLGCAVCHEHKYDPITQEEFYQLYGYFNSLSGNGMDGNALLPAPSIRVPTPEQTARLVSLRAKLRPIQQAIGTALTKIQYTDPHNELDRKVETRRDYVWIDDAVPAGAKPGGNGGAKSWQFVSSPRFPVFSGSRATRRTSSGLSQHYFTGAGPGLRIGQGDVLFAYVYLDPQNPPKQIMLQFNNGNWEHRSVWGDDLIAWGKRGTASRRRFGPLPPVGKWVRLEVPAARVGLKPGMVINGWAFTQYGGTVYWDSAGIRTETPQNGSSYNSQQAWEQVQRKQKKSSLPGPVIAAIRIDRSKRKPSQKKLIRDYFIENVYAKTRALFAPLHQRLAAVKKQIADLEKTIPATMICQDLPKPRETHMLIRGAYNKPGVKLEPGVPASLPALPKNAPPNRLALARWLVSGEHPLTARVTVNRFWQHYFGVGIVKTAEDFGSQGEWPSHPQLLDWLAVEFTDSGWDVKHIQKLIVMSGTYRQNSRVTPGTYRRDPENRLLSHGPRYRMDAEMIRDNALAISGLLVKRIGGPSVKPYQPAGLWKAVGYTDSNTANFKQDHGNALYRRSMYTFWKRTSPPPSMVTFDAPSREACTVRRARTDTPLQALVLMNDIQFVEAARNLAQRMMTVAGNRPADRIAFAFRLATARRPRPDESAVFLKLYEAQLALYQHDPKAATKLVNVGESKRNEKLNVSELAAWTMIANVILNLDETVTKG